MFIYLGFGLKTPLTSHHLILGHSKVLSDYISLSSVTFHRPPEGRGKVVPLLKYHAVKTCGSLEV
jgi:hypothetical protein